MTVLGCLFFYKSFRIICWSPHSLKHFWGGVESLEISHLFRPLSTLPDSAAGGARHPRLSQNPTTGFPPLSAPVQSFSHRMHLLGLSCHLTFLLWPGPSHLDLKWSFQGTNKWAERLAMRSQCDFFISKSLGASWNHLLQVYKQTYK